MPKIVHDCPFGESRCISAVGYQATVCNGAVVLREDKLTGERPRRVLRS